MASVTSEKRNGRTLYRVCFRNEHRERKAIRLPGVSKKDASEVASKVQAIVSARITGSPYPNAIAEWLEAIGDDLHGKLSAAELVAPRRFATLAGFIGAFIDARRATSKPRTIINWEAAKTKLVEYFGAERELRDIQPAEADAWRRSLAAKYAQATVSAHVKRAKAFFAEAIEQGFLADSPLAKLVAGDDSNAERKHYIKPQEAEELLKVAPDSQWRLLIALARFGGLRTPSETLRLKWIDIDWEAGTMRVESPKTAKQGKAFRVVPIFEELKPYLLEAAEQASEGAIYCIERYRDGETNLRTHLLRLIERANLQPWPRLWHNLRASRATDLCDRFPSHIAAAWLGHTETIADRNYRTVTAEHLAMARGGTGGTGGGDAPSRNALKPLAVTEHSAAKRVWKTSVFRDSHCTQIPRRGVEPLSPP